MRNGSTKTPYLYFVSKHGIKNQEFMWLHMLYIVCTMVCKVQILNIFFFSIGLLYSMFGYIYYFAYRFVLSNSCMFLSIYILLHFKIRFSVFYCNFTPIKDKQCCCFCLRILIFNVILISYVTYI